MKILKNYLYNVSYQMLRIILPIITMPYVARVLGPDAVGKYAVSAAFVNYFVIFGMIGLDIYGTRQIAFARDDEEKTKSVFWEINILKSISIILVSVIYYVSICLFFKGSFTLYFVQTLVLLASFFDISWFFNGKEEFKKTAVRNIIVKLVSVILIFALVHAPSDLVLYTLIISGSIFIGQAVMWIDVKKILFPIPKIVYKNIFIHSKNTLKLWIPSLAVSVYTSLDKVMLGVFTTNYQVGVYDYSQNIVKVLSTITTTLATVTAPRAANYIEKNDEAGFQKLFGNSIKIITIFAIPLVGGVIGVRNTFVSWFLGSQYVEVSELLLFSAWIILPISLSQLVGNQILIAKRMEKQYTISIISGALTNLVFNFMLVKPLQARGVLIASVAAEIVVLVLMMVQSRNIVNYKTCFSGTLKYVIITFFMSVIIFYIGEFMGQSVISTIIQVIVGTFVYGVILLIIKEEFLVSFLSSIRKSLQIK